MAIIETSAAISVVFYLNAQWNTLHWLSVAMCISPLLLLRTEELTKRTAEQAATIAGTSLCYQTD